MKTDVKNLSDRTAPETFAGHLQEYLLKYKNAIVAYSGGIDSAVLAYMTHLSLGDKMVAAIADSPSLSRREFRSALDFAQCHGIPVKIVKTGEMENANYRSNPANRCYYCKKALFKKIEELRGQLEKFYGNSSFAIFYGANLDDVKDYRPGMQAAREASIKAPYIELGIDKRAIRAIAANYRLGIKDKPAMPCMSSRIPYGEEVTLKKLNQVEKAEDFLYNIGFKILRVRHHGPLARIEVPARHFRDLLDHRIKIKKKFKELGFIFVSLDLDDFKSGSLNAVLKSK